MAIEDIDPDLTEKMAPITIPKPEELSLDRFKSKREATNATSQIWSLHEDPELTVDWDMGPPSNPPDLRGKSCEDVVKLMVEWFNDNFEHPAESTPFDEEYIYLWGGPYDTREEIEAAFARTFPEEILVEAVSKIEEDGNYEWAPSINRMRPDKPRDDVVNSKLRLFEVLKAWDRARVVDVDLCLPTPTTDFDSAAAEFRVKDVALLMRDHRRLTKKIRKIKAAIEKIFPKA